MNFKGRLTKKKLIEILNEKFKSLEIENYIVTAIVNTRFPGHVLEGGAAQLLIRVEHVQDSNQFVYMISSYSIGDLQRYINDGYRLIIKDNSNFGIISSFEVDVAKI